jgi:uncharacterized protein YbaP (TraB family)
LLSLIIVSPSDAQRKAAVKKYPSLFWEITGKGLKKPSYLFGTMHVSSKMVFHLSDSFYYAMRSSDAVALELNPEIWQDEMFRLQKAQLNLNRFTLGKMNDFLKESSFKLEKYEDDIKRALTEEPTVVNNLLYRSYQSMADYEENTYLDLYIYQTGRKLGKKSAGVENYLESERLMMEAYQDMAKDKSKRRTDGEGESFYDIQKKLQQAYRSGDLDLLDSLQNLSTISAAFSEKFLYVRNEIQANSIDTIIRRNSLFAGVGAAHLPGPRGVIELLRKKGYHLRPVFMQDRDASQKEEIDKLRVPVVFQGESLPDGTIQLQLPGKLYKREEAKGNESWQYADMNNGAYYMLTRVRTHAAMLGDNEKAVFTKVENMLYENIPGRIIRKKNITKNGYAGFDVTNRTRRGDLQRYQVIITPFEVLVFKMSGNDDYVDGEEADQFFNSLKILPRTNNANELYQPKQGGFEIKMANTVSEAFNRSAADGSGRWEYESVDSNTGSAYMIWKKSVYNFNFIGEDTFDLALIEESFKSSEIIQKQLYRKKGINNNLPFLESKYLLKEGQGYITTKAIINGPHYYLLIGRSKNRSATFSPFFNSFKAIPFVYAAAQKYVDSTLHIEVISSVRPNVDTVLRSWMEKAGNEGASGLPARYSGWPKNKTGIFKSDSTGESILVTVQNFPKYYYSRDTARFWQERLEEKELEKDLVFTKKEFFKINDSLSGYQVLLTDTSSRRAIKILYYLAGHRLYKFSTLVDTAQTESEFVKTFFATVKPVSRKSGTSVFKTKTDTFFADYNSTDSANAKLANEAIASVYFGKDGVERIVRAINSLKYGDKDYFDTKSKFITELGYINDTSSNEKLVGVLKNLYERNADTSYFQNPVLGALARVHTISSYKLLKDLLVQEPPVFNDNYEYTRIFTQFNDSLNLSKVLFPEILQLASLEDYKPFVNTLLKTLVDSGFLKGKDYESYFSKLYFDAKVELKKQQNKDEKRLEMQNEEDDNDYVNDAGYRSIYNNNGSAEGFSLHDYAALLIPFYDKFHSVPRYFEKLLQSRDVSVQLAAAKLMLANNKKIPDSLFTSIASQDRYSAKLLFMLREMNREELFPARYKKQELIAKSLLLNDKNYNEYADIKLVYERIVELKGTTGNVYFFKYKIRKDDEWKIGISGMQPVNKKEVSNNDEIVKLTDKKLSSNEPELTQFDEQLKKILLARHKGGKKFFENSNSLDFSNNDFDD